MPSTKKRIRDIERLLRREGHSEEVRKRLEDDLSNLRIEHQQHLDQEKERLLSTKYRMIKFFERKKVTRRIHSIDNELQAAAAAAASSKDDRSVKLQQEKYCLLQDLAYIMYYPRNMKYISLTAKDGQPDDATSSSNRAKARVLALASWEEDQQVGDELQHAKTTCSCS
jgi:hypothetical protein